MEDAAFKRDRLQAAVTKLGERLEQLKDQEENERRQLAYDKAAAERDQLAAELADLYPGFAKKLGELLSRVAASDREIEFINDHKLPKGADRLLVAELKARGLAALGQQLHTGAAHYAAAVSAALARAHGLLLAAKMKEWCKALSFGSLLNT
jgi:hypothetical protein